jgi:hypothetical protein
MSGVLSSGERISLNLRTPIVTKKRSVGTKGSALMTIERNVGMGEPLEEWEVKRRAVLALSNQNHRFNPPGLTES